MAKYSQETKYEKIMMKLRNEMSSALALRV